MYAITTSKTEATQPSLKARVVYTINAHIRAVPMYTPVESDGSKDSKYSNTKYAVMDVEAVTHRTRDTAPTRPTGVVMRCRKIFTA